ncbi:hypothetical protein C8R34_10598 [Nitrosomonas sp. Nm84]|uniref:hypothetical protein n=1 Tax=Nitrosomonas sp. Nm84 TaxID=200124 RepID=UPI000D764C45|nr:hypothetical protein [Nitrosomonas sp. Nm84]PXW89117.1 hypothetical protein C8R34_10598 [Nitrosomonas sp. Nm84]
MGDWSDYFEDFPEENPANWVNGHFDPVLREKLNAEERLQAAANSELLGMIKKAKNETKARSLLITENCPQCGLDKLNTYKISKHFYLCECLECGIYGSGKSHYEALEKTNSALGEGLDWRDN